MGVVTSLKMWFNMSMLVCQLSCLQMELCSLMHSNIEMDNSVDKSQFDRAEHECEAIPPQAYERAKQSSMATDHENVCKRLDEYRTGIPAVSISAR